MQLAKIAKHGGKCLKVSFSRNSRMTRVGVDDVRHSHIPFSTTVLFLVLCFKLILDKKFLTF